MLNNILVSAVDGDDDDDGNFELKEREHQRYMKDFSIVASVTNQIGNEDDELRLAQ